MSKNSSNLSTLCRRAAAFLATLALLAAMTLPVYAEAMTEEPTLTTESAETGNVPKTVEDASASTEPNDMTDTASEEPSNDSDNTADDAADDTAPSTNDTDTTPNTPAGETPDDSIVEAPDEDSNSEADGTMNSEIPEDVAAEDEAVDDIALYDSATEAYFDIYFALPKDWNDAQKIYFQGMRGNQAADGYSPKREMTLVADTDKTTVDGKKIYKVNLHYKQGDTNQDIDCSYGGFAKIVFTKDDDTTGVSAKLTYDGNSTTQFWQRYETLQDYYYDSDTQQWIAISELKPRHTHLASQKFTFKNMAGSDLANMQAVFYDKAEGSTELTQVKTVNLGSVQTKQSAEVAIPDDVACAYVAFFADGVRLGNCFNFCNDDSTTENVTSFLYSASQNCFVYTNSGNVVLTEEGSRKFIMMQHSLSWTQKIPIAQFPMRVGWFIIICGTPKIHRKNKMV